MFPIQLRFFLATPTENVSAPALHALLPGLGWGEESDLMAHSDQWPVAVALVKDRHGYEPEERCDFPAEVNFVHFPGRVTGNDAVMLPVKLALLRRLALNFECRVLCDAQGFCIEDEERSGHAYAWTESLLCQSGRIFSGVVPAYDVRDGARPAEPWMPLDETPQVFLNANGTLKHEERAIRQVKDWIESRDVSHLRRPRHPVFPAPPSEPDRSATPGEIEAEMDREFPPDDVLDREEADWETYTERLEAWEKGIGTTSSKQLISEGVALPPPDSLDDENLSEKLWEVIHGLRKKNTFLYHTDHLSDRELYTWMWEEGLNESTMDLSGLSDCGCHTSPIGSGDEESTLISLTYYDSAENRADWKASWPDDPIPAHLDPPCDRDRWLPRGDYDVR